MTIRIGINGFGRMGRLAMRVAWDWPELEIVHINEVKGGAECAAHLLEFDTIHGRWPHPVTSNGTDTIRICDKSVSFSEASKPSDVNWGDMGVDIVLECTGKFKTPETLQPYYEKGVKKVIVAAPVKDEALNIVYGVNHHLYDPAKHNLVTAASCTTNCLAPVVKVIHENLGIERGSITTIHDVTNTQTIVDGPHQDLRRARSCLNSLIPTTTGSAKAITMIYPELTGKLNGHAVRVPLLNGSLTDCVFEVSRKTTAVEINSLFQNAAENGLSGILGFEAKPLVSADFVNDARSSIIDGPSTMVVDDTHVKIYAWYDNEWGYVNRMIDITKHIASFM
ncbi:ArsJ-associated glyceraldehyde-3-phosphate dehydrogenase [Sneathiella sp. P13V-1]|uniref:ArsJ-associated glyceraldehyde-3-phosphate dehydrogenase n=1 Tax=Sneathiella sp. P13V-1 TaxID=2697366 RepID=UPI00187B7022|nr:ArsJ-associated glyceraldehyde-3-phosphate dehydrogenase [Sneathiella sp. P13V-1]MBE7637748.1 ArsJ-associated glyceraldehyde-3-phosphate dehydrogenase [Sneathiella sp. P13V-1]